MNFKQIKTQQGVSDFPDVFPLSFLHVCVRVDAFEIADPTLASIAINTEGSANTYSGSTHIVIFFALLSCVAARYL